MCTFLGLQMSLNPTLPQLGLGPVSYFGGEGRVEKSNLDPCVNLSTKKAQCPPGCQETGRGGHKGSSSSVARCTLTTILQAHFTDGNIEVRRREGTLPRPHRASKAEHRPELRLQIQGSLPYEVNLAKPGSGEQRTFSLNQRGKFRRRRKKKRSSRRSFQGWSPAQPVPGLREGGNDAAWARGSLRSTIHRESACGGSQFCRGSGKDG